MRTKYEIVVVGGGVIIQITVHEQCESIIVGSVNRNRIPSFDGFHRFHIVHRTRIAHTHTAKQAHNAMAHKMKFII